VPPTAAVSFDVSPTTCYRYVTEAVALLAARAPSLDQALAGRQGKVTILDGTIIVTFRVRWTGQHKRWWSHRKRTYGVNLQALSGEAGDLLWISDGLRGSTHDLSAAPLARRHRRRRPARPAVWADCGYQGEAPILITPVRAGKNTSLPRRPWYTTGAPPPSGHQGSVAKPRSPGAGRY
jgi:hypothetical protein